MKTGAPFTLREIRNRIHSVENVKKITGAMEKVAAAKLKNAQEKAEKSRPYLEKMKILLQDLAAAKIDHPLFKHRKSSKILLLVVSGDKGLSGSYNTNLFHAADHFQKQYDSNQISRYLFGKKGINYYTNKQVSISSSFVDWPKKFNLPEQKELADRLLHAFLTNEIAEIWFIYTRYITLFTREVVVEKMFDFDAHKKPDLDFIYEPSETKVVDAVLPRYALALIQNVLYEAYSSELAARVVAMQSATQNSEELIQRLTLLKNRARQESITREILDIVPHL